jgi:predicted amidophosphoribosyltransferase
MSAGASDAGGQSTCSGCGRAFPADTPDIDLCPACMAELTRQYAELRLRDQVNEEPHQDYADIPY